MFDGGIFAVAGLGVGLLFAVVVLWTIIWKGFALWIASKEEKKKWFVAMLLLNTAGILEIVFIFGFSKWGKDYFAKRKENKKKNKV
jgi:hypothetical protein